VGALLAEEGYLTEKEARRLFDEAPPTGRDEVMRGLQMGLAEVKSELVPTSLEIRIHRSFT
jgi:hypothetical protein